YRETVASEVARVAVQISSGPVNHLRYPAAKLDVTPLHEIVDSLAKLIAQIRPTIVYSVGPHDVNSDHTIVFRALGIALKPVGAPSVRRFLTFEVPSSTDWALHPADG